MGSRVTLRYEPRIRQDLGGVRLHRDDEASELARHAGARAFDGGPGRVLREGGVSTGHPRQAAARAEAEVRAGGFVFVQERAVGVPLCCAGMRSQRGLGVTRHAMLLAN
jgi:hypothetical protein